LRRLREIARNSPYDVDFGIAPVFLAADLSARSGADAEAVDGFRRFRSLFIPTAMWRSWALAHSLLAEAESLARLGRVTEAQHALDRFDAEWEGADPGLPLLARAGAVASQLSGLARGGE
jgi:hypothetical protein